MHIRTALLASLLAVSAFAQDEWSTFPPAPAPAKPAETPPTADTPPPAPAATPPAAKPVPAPVPAPRVSPSVSNADKTLAGRVERNTSADAGTGEVRIVSQKERFVAGTEPHSPSTYGNAFDAPSNGRVTVGQAGISGLLVPSARLGPQGVVRVSLLGEYLNQASFPVRGATNIRSAVTFAASIQPLQWLEVFVSYGAAANTNNRTSPNLLQALGDLTLGVKGSREWVKGLHAGVELRLLTFSAVGNQSVDRFAFGFRPTLLAAYDIRAAAPKVPLIFNVAVGFTFDSTGGLVATQRLNASEEFALAINRYNRFNFGASLEIPLPWVIPTIEYSLSSPLGVANGTLTGPDGSVIQVGQAMNQQLGLGLKLTVIKDLTLTGGVNIGLAQRVGLGVPATPPWNLLLGAAFAIDPFQRGEQKIVETIQERKVKQAVATAPTARVEGLVLDAQTNRPLAGAIVSVAGAPSAATDATGAFRTVELENLTQAKLTVSKEGYVAAEQSVPLTPGKPSRAELALQPDAKPSVFDLYVVSNKKAVKATVAVKGPTETSFMQEDTAQGPTQVQVNAGTYSLTVSAEGFLSQTRDVQIAKASTMPLTFELQPMPKKTLVIFKDGKIEILQQVHFATGKATILADSFSLLQQVVDVVIRNNVKRVRVEGHTDNKGVKAANQTLSEQRASAVVDYLVAQGIDRTRLESAGFGDSKPVAPNLTARGRELNRRVEFIVLER
jgi:OmpA-OmpF porin, OOP family